MKNKRSVLCTAALLSFACALFCFFLCKGIAFFHEKQFYEKIAAVAADRPDDMVNLIDNLTTRLKIKRNKAKSCLPATAIGEGCFLILPCLPFFCFWGVLLSCSEYYGDYSFLFFKGKTEESAPSPTTSTE